MPTLYNPLAIFFAAAILAAFLAAFFLILAALNGQSDCTHVPLLE
jgi:hypothetical protein